MPEGTALVGAALAAYVTKDGIVKLLGPTADYLGESLKDFVEQRAKNVGQIFENATRKLGDKINDEGQVPPKVLKTVINEGSYSSDEIALEYFGGILASSRSEKGRDDRGARIAKILDSLSVYQIRSHYIIYSLMRELFQDSGYEFDLTDRPKMHIFIPWEAYTGAMDFDDHEGKQSTQIVSHSFFGLHSEGLIEYFQFGQQQHLQKISDQISGDGIVVKPSAFGAELFLWAHGHGDKMLSYILSAENLEPIYDIEVSKVRAVALGAVHV